jgi:hypothetical protein
VLVPGMGRVARSHRGLTLTAALVAAAALLAALLVAPPADARYSKKKSIWGPTQVHGKSQFPIYRDLGVSLYQMAVRWNQVAPTQPQDPGNPNDPAYRWPAEVEYALKEGRRYGIRVAIMLISTPPWANGDRPFEWAPSNPRDFAKFARAASRRYPSVRHWQIWGEPSKHQNFQPMTYGDPTGPRLYARILDAAYASLKRQSRRNIVIGGNTWTVGTVPPLQFIRAMRLPNGRSPRMDLFGHNPFTRRRPVLNQPPLGDGLADFGDLDTLVRWIDRYVGKPQGRPLRLYLSEFTLTTHPEGREFDFSFTRKRQARWLATALRVVRRWDRIHTFGWISLHDEAPNRPDGQAPSNRGLVEWDGDRKPAYRAFKRG